MRMCVVNISFLTFGLSSTTVHINTSGLLDKRNALASIEGELSAGHTVFVRLKFISLSLDRSLATGKGHLLTTTSLFARDHHS